MVTSLGDLNNNANNIVLDYQIRDKTDKLLDVTIVRNLNELGTKVYFKQTDRNNYLSIRSRHHPAWIKNTPKGQILRVRHNCIKEEDYYIEANILKEKFIQKGYKENILN